MDQSISIIVCLEFGLPKPQWSHSLVLSHEESAYMAERWPHGLPNMCVLYQHYFNIRHDQPNIVVPKVVSIAEMNVDNEWPARYSE